MIIWTDAIAIGLLIFKRNDHFYIILLFVDKHNCTLMQFKNCRRPFWDYDKIWINCAAPHLQCANTAGKNDQRSSLDVFSLVKKVHEVPFFYLGEAIYDPKYSIFSNSKHLKNMDGG